MRCYCSTDLTRRKGHKKKGKHKGHKHKKGSKAGRKLGQYSRCLKKNGRSAAAKAECRHKVWD